MFTLIHSELGTLDNVTEPLDAECDRSGIFNIEVEKWELVESRIFQFYIISNYFISLEIFLVYET